MRYLLLFINFIVFIFKILKIYLNKKEREKGLPESLKDFYSQSQHQKWLHYEDDTDRFSLIRNTFHFVITIILLMSPFYSWLSSLFVNHVLMNSLLMMIVLYIFESILSLMESYYVTFVIEEKFGMNNTTIKTFLIDAIKEFVVDLLLIVILMSFVHYFYQWFSYYGFIIIFIILAIIMYIIQRNSLWILKIYNQFTPLEDNELKQRLIELVEKEGFELKGVYVMDASKRTKRANAFCLGEKKKEICIDDNMFKYYSDDEILAVFCHELGHAVYNHSHKLKWFTYMKGILLFLLFIYVLVNPSLYVDFGIHQLNYYMAMYVLSTLVTPIMFFIDIPINYYSRKCEEEADEFAVQQGYGRDLARLLKKLTRDDLSDVSPDPLIAKLTYSHPPLIQRLNHIEKVLME